MTTEKHKSKNCRLVWELLHTNEYFNSLANEYSQLSPTREVAARRLLAYLRTMESDIEFKGLKLTYTSIFNGLADIYPNSRVNIKRRKKRPL